MDREELIHEAERLVAAHGELRVAANRSLQARKREQEALADLYLCEEKFTTAIGLAFPIGALKIAEALLLVAGQVPSEPCK